MLPRSTGELINREIVYRFIASLSCLLVLFLTAHAQSQGLKTNAIKPSEDSTNNFTDPKSVEAQRRDFAISLVISLSTEARSYSDLTDRARVLARSADVLWDADNVTARALFARAWEAAERGDSDEVTVKTKDKPPDMVIALRKMSGEDLRSEVLSLASRRDRKLGEQFLAKLKSETEREAGDAKNNKSRDVYSGSEGASRRLQVASKLLSAGQVEQAREFAAPALTEVNSRSINFLSELRLKDPVAADQIFAALLAASEFDPVADANTISGLSSYAFTPGFYVVFWSGGPSTWTQPEGPTTPPNLPPALRDRFFQVAASVLLRPLPPPDKDYTTCGPGGRMRVIVRLLPLFDQYAPDAATALRGQLQGNTARNLLNSDSQLLREDIKPEPNGQAFANIQDELDHAKNSADRDTINASAAVNLAPKGDKRAREYANSIDDSKLRDEMLHYVDFEFLKFAIQKKDAAEVARLGKSGELSHIERAWAYVRTARLLNESDHERAISFLQQAIDEARRIDAGDPNCAFALVAIANELLSADRARSWELLNEAVKAANSTDQFFGDDTRSPKWSMVVTRRFTRFIKLPAEDFSLPHLLSSLAQDELERSVEVTKTFKYDATRANATLAIARAMLDKPTKK